MNSFFLQLVQKFELAFQSLSQSSPVFFQETKHHVFFQRWLEVHKKLMKQICEENFEEMELENKEFIKKRSRMVSAFVQNINRNPNKQQLLPLFQELLKDFDDMFKSFLQEILNYFSAELVKAQRFRKVTAAYAHSYET